MINIFLQIEFGHVKEYLKSENVLLPGKHYHELVYACDQGKCYNRNVQTKNIFNFIKFIHKLIGTCCEFNLARTLAIFGDGYEI